MKKIIFVFIMLLNVLTSSNNLVNAYTGGSATDIATANTKFDVASNKNNIDKKEEISNTKKLGSEPEKSIGDSGNKKDNQFLKSDLAKRQDCRGAKKCSTIKYYKTNLEPIGFKYGGVIEEDVIDNGYLGVSKHFHIFAKKATIKAHVNGNVAVGYLEAHNNFGTGIRENTLGKDLYYIGKVGTIQSSSFVTSQRNRINKVVFGAGVELTLVDNGNKVAANGSKLDHLNKDEIFQDKNGNKYIDFEKEFMKLKNTSNEIATNRQTEGVDKNFRDENNRYFDVSKVRTTTLGTVILTKTDEKGKLLDGVTFDLYRVGKDVPVRTGVKTENGKITITGLEKGDYYFKETETIDGYVLNTDENQFSITDENLGSGNTIYLNLTKEELEKDRPIIIRGLAKSGANVVVNVDTNHSEVVNIGAEIKLKYTDGTDRPNKETEDFSDAVVLWNFYNKANNQKININRARFQGSILAVGAIINIGQNVDGNIIADTVNVIGGETHRWDYQERNVIKPNPVEIKIINKMRKAPTTKVNFSKKAITEKGKDLKGATIKLTKEDGTVVKEWVTDGSQTEFHLNDGMYTFTEVSAPAKYQVATAITFEVKGGKVMVKGTEVSDNTIVMVDKLRDIPTKKTNSTLPKTGTGGKLSPYARLMFILGVLLVAIGQRYKNKTK